MVDGPPMRQEPARARLGTPTDHPPSRDRPQAPQSLSQAGPGYARTRTRVAIFAFRTLEGVRFTQRARVKRTLIRETRISNRQNAGFGGRKRETLGVQKNDRFIELRRRHETEAA